MSAAISRAFERIGARVKLLEADDLRLDVGRDRRGEFFEVRAPKRIELVPLDVRPKDRHILLMTRDGEVKARFLCGHDERAWFVAAIPESYPVSTVEQAKEALKPALVRERQRGLKPKLRDRRRNPAYVRQGEWFFVPASEFLADEQLVLKDEPITRGRGSTAHVAAEAIRIGGETVYVAEAVPEEDRALFEEHPELNQGLTQEEYERFVRENADARDWTWQVMRRNPELYVRGRVSHPEHKTVMLKGWHRVHMNTEPEARAGSSVVFLD